MTETNPVNLLTLVLVLMALVEPSRQQLYANTFNFPTDESESFLNCANRTILQLGDECQLLKVFNQTQVDLMDEEALRNTSYECACQLNYMADLWLETFDTVETRRVATMVVRIITRDNQTVKHPDYLWSDLDVTVHRVSIYTATKDFFYQQRHNKSLAFSQSLRKSLEKDPVWLMIRNTCRLVAEDPLKLYRYMENLNRLEPVAFIKLISTVFAIGNIYQASKACKLPLMLHLHEYRTRPENMNLVRVDSDGSVHSTVWEQAIRESENLVSNDIDLMLKDASVQLLKCNKWQERDSNSIQKLAERCPMMMGDQVVTKWLSDHPTPSDRSQIAIECGCKLLMHNSTWTRIMSDRNVQIMSKSLTDYMNRNRVPDFGNTPIWSIYSWFTEIMSKFVNNRKMSVKEVVKARIGSEDPTTIVNDKTDDFSRALELLRRGCNLIMFNYRKGSKESFELRLIHYLDNLQLISRDPMFVFHLTLQDPNLFKLHALSKMCEPIVK